MRTILNLDETALTEAMRVAPGKSKTEVINAALRDFACRGKIQDLLKFEGKMRWEGNLDELRLRTRRRP
jgi:Arc/MetJ family transcription regulator